MNLALSDEQVFLREAARGALSRFKTLEAAREALDGNESAMPDLWPMAKEAGWPGLLIDEAHGGAGLDAFDAMLVLGECGRVLAGVPLLGHLPATAIVNASPNAASWIGELASGEKRAAYLPSCPPDDLGGDWSSDPRRGLVRGELPVGAAADGVGAGDHRQRALARVVGPVRARADARVEAGGEHVDDLLLPGRDRVGEVLVAGRVIEGCDYGGFHLVGDTNKIGSCRQPSC